MPGQPFDDSTTNDPQHLPMRYQFTATGGLRELPPEECPLCSADLREPGSVWIGWNTSFRRRSYWCQTCDRHWVPTSTKLYVDADGRPVDPPDYLT